MTVKKNEVVTDNGKKWSCAWRRKKNEVVTDDGKKWSSKKKWLKKNQFYLLYTGSNFLIKKNNIFLCYDIYEKQFSLNKK